MPVAERGGQAFIHGLSPHLKRLDGPQSGSHPGFVVPNPRASTGGEMVYGIKP